MFRNFLDGDIKNPEGVRLYPTTFRLPVWTRPLTISTALTRFRVSEPRVKLISEKFDLERGLFRSLYKPQFRPVLNPRDLLDSIKAEAAVDGVEVVEWMQLAAAENAVLSARMAEYNRLGSQLVSGSTDAYIPGLIVEDCYVQADIGSTVGSRGYAIARTPRGSFNIPRLRKAPGIFRDLITWASMYYQGAVQHCETLLKWRSLAETPIRNAVGFYSDYRGNTAPNFFVQVPTRPSLSVTVRQRFSSDKDQTLAVNFRDPTNYSRVVGSKSVAIATGTSEVTYTVSAFPYVPPTIAEIQPSDNTSTKLEEFVVA